MEKIIDKIDEAKSAIESLSGDEVDEFNELFIKKMSIKKNEE